MGRLLRFLFAGLERLRHETFQPPRRITEGRSRKLDRFTGYTAS